MEDFFWKMFSYIAVIIIFELSLYVFLIQFPFLGLLLKVLIALVMVLTVFFVLISLVLMITDWHEFFSKR
ncbi:hypothetical protein [Lacticaseibacillus paracasei]|uniref:hypothetical protein n=1 Tax=Lacticaseibacillus paracasei TaxID=1597 RepID=UPI001C458980|nr:hypothetical protein [Lacticaseibacillus paracasei]QXJ67529.1 hypothetical protein J5Y16_11560 [Lacticaseibacillus paracasei subsp. paracasei]DAH91771.1 MAG TPA: hypothetical protein [Caudoviricetes sp.]